jgi:hypothetical protein
MDVVLARFRGMVRKFFGCQFFFLLTMDSECHEEEF